MATTLKENVFLGYRGVDIRFSFVSHLSAAFRRQGITFVQDSYTQCDLLSDEARAAVRESKLSVIVFSESYAFCKPCLDTLVEVHECRHHNGQVLIPVFYGVSRTEVENQSGRFAGPFYFHERTEKAQLVEKWRAVLADAARLPGHESNDERSDSELVEEIVRDVHEKLFPTDQIGINSRLLEIQNLLCKQPWGVRSIGIWGMGGIGKTTIAQAAFNLMSGDFEAHCFIGDFTMKFREKGPVCLREELFPNILEDKHETKYSNTNQSQPWNKLRRRRVLLVLDDVHNPINAESFIAGFNGFGHGSLIIITTRDKQVLIQCGVNQIYEVKGLNEDEALHLFSRSAFGTDVTDPNLLRLSKQVVEYSDGNPKALSFYGRILKGKTPTEMETTFLELKQHPPYQILDVVKTSYDELSENEKNIFLDIACFFRGENVNYVMQVLEGCGFFPRVGIDALVEKSLVYISENRLQMHNLIQAIGREIVNEETIQLERGRRLWIPSSIKYLLEDTELKASSNGTEDIEGIVLDTSNLSFAVNSMAFESMYNLRILKIYSSSPGSHYGLSLPRGLASLPYELRLLHWENYPLKSLPQDFDPGYLVELNMPYSQLHELWGDKANLQRLKTIRLNHSQQLLKIDELPQAENIEVIDLQGCTGLQSFPAMSSIQHLRILNLSDCVGIKTFPEVPSNIEELYLEGTGITEIPASIETLSRLIKLSLGRCKKLLTIPKKIEKLKALEVLNLSGCLGLKNFPNIRERMRNLCYLYLSGTAIEEFHPWISKMIGLKVLVVSMNLKKAPPSLKKLKHLRIEFDGSFEPIS